MQQAHEPSLQTKTSLNMSFTRENESGHQKTYPLCCCLPTQVTSTFGVFEANLLLREISSKFCFNTIHALLNSSVCTTFGENQLRLSDQNDAW